MRVVDVAAAGLMALALAGGATTAGRAAVLFTADLTTAQEVPSPTLTTSTGAPRPVSSGNATFTLNDAQDALAVSATIFNIDVTGTQTPDPNDNLVAAHIHALAPPGVIA